MGHLEVPFSKGLPPNESRGFRTYCAGDHTKPTVLPPLYGGEGCGDGQFIG